jgi:hypothetical protein
MVLDKCGSRTSTFDFQAMASVLCFGVFICGRDEWDDEILKRSEELGSSLVCNEILQCSTHMLLLFVVSIVSVLAALMMLLRDGTCRCARNFGMKADILHLRL